MLHTLIRRAGSALSLLTTTGSGLTTTGSGLTTPSVEGAAPPLIPYATDDLFGEVVERFYREHWSRTKTGKRQVRSLIDFCLAPARGIKPEPKKPGPGLGDVPANRLTREMIAEWFAAHSDLRPRVANRALKCARQAWRELMPHAPNPFQRVHLNPERARTRRFGSSERCRWAQALEELRAENGVFDVTADALLVLRGTMARTSEILRLRVEQLDVEAKVALLSEHKTDNHDSTREIHLDLVMPVIIKRIEAAKKSGTPYLFPSKRSRTGHLMHVRPAFLKVCKRAGIVITSDVTPHLLRGDGATHLLDQDVDLRKVQAILGHSDPSTTARYARVSRDTASKAIRRGAGELGVAGAGGTAGDASLEKLVQFDKLVTMLHTGDVAGALQYVLEAQQRLAAGRRGAA